MILEIIEPYIEVINLILAFVIVIAGMVIWKKLEGNLKTGWSYFAVAIILFGLHEVVGSLAEFGFFEIEGLYAFSEFVYIIALLMAVFSFKKLLDGLSSKRGGGKK